MSVVLPAGVRGILKPGGPQTLDPRNFAVPDGLVGYWGFDADCLEFTAGNALDLSGKGNNGTLTGFSSASLKGGQVAESILFDGSTNYVGCSAINGAIKSEGCFAVWIKPSSLSVNNRKIISIGSGPGGNGNYTRLYLKNSTTVIVDIYTTTTNLIQVSYPSISVGMWLHFAYLNSVSYSRSELYINGQLNGIGTKYQDGSSGHAYLEIGADSVGHIEKFAGSIDDIRLYNRALAPWEITQLYQAGLAGRRDAGDQMPAWNDLPMLRSSIVPIAMHHYMTQRAA